MQLFERVQQSLGIVTGGVGIFDGQQIGFVFGVAAEFLDGEWSGESAYIGSSRARGARNVSNRVDNAADVTSSHGAGGVAGGNVGDLVGHHGGEFGFIIGGENQCAVHIQKSAGKAVGAGNIAGVDDLDREGNLRIGIADDLLSKAVDVGVYGIVVNDLGGAVESGGDVAAEFELAFHRVQVESVPDTALADVLDVVFLGLLGVFRSFFTGCFDRWKRRWLPGLRCGRGHRDHGAENESECAGQASRSRVDFSLGFIEAG